MTTLKSGSFVNYICQPDKTYCKSLQQWSNTTSTSLTSRTATASDEAEIMANENSAHQFSIGHNSVPLQWLKCRIQNWLWIWLAEFLKLACSTRLITSKHTGLQHQQRQHCYFDGWIFKVGSKNALRLVRIQQCFQHSLGYITSFASDIIILLIKSTAFLQVEYLKSSLMLVTKALHIVANVTTQPL